MPSIIGCSTCDACRASWMNRCVQAGPRLANSGASTFTATVRPRTASSASNTMPFEPRRTVGGAVGRALAELLDAAGGEKMLQRGKTDEILLDQVEFFNRPAVKNPALDQKLGHRFAGRTVGEPPGPHVADFRVRKEG